MCGNRIEIFEQLNREGKEMKKKRKARNRKKQ